MPTAVSVKAGMLNPLKAALWLAGLTVPLVSARGTGYGIGQKNADSQMLFGDTPGHKEIKPPRALQTFS